MPTVSCQTQLSGPVTLTSTAMTMLVKSQGRNASFTLASRSLAPGSPAHGRYNAFSSPKAAHGAPRPRQPRSRSPAPPSITGMNESLSTTHRHGAAGLLELLPTHNQSAEQLLDSVAEPGAAFIERRRVLEIIADLMACAEGKMELPQQHTTPALSYTNNHRILTSIPELKFALQCQDSAASVCTLQPPTARTETAEIGAEEFDGTFTLNQYVMLQSIGHGAQGEVFLSVDLDKNEMRAIKAIPRPGGGGKLASDARSPLELARANRAAQHEREIEVMKRCRHRNIVSLYEVIDDPTSDKLYLVMQYIEHGSLVTLLPDGTVSQVVKPELLAQYTRQLCAGLQYLHSHGVVHRDIKPDNILLGADDTVYLSDFGVADVFDAHTLTSPVLGTRGTSAFLAPELIDSTSAVDGRAVDIWALGVTLYALLYGRLPWRREGSTFEFWRLVAEVDPPLPCIDAVNFKADHEWRALLQAMLHKDPKLRCTAEQARAKAKAIEAAYDVGSPQVLSNAGACMVDFTPIVVPPMLSVRRDSSCPTSRDASFVSRTLMPHLHSADPNANSATRSVWSSATSASAVDGMRLSVSGD